MKSSSTKTFESEKIFWELVARIFYTMNLDLYSSVNFLGTNGIFEKSFL